jgi:DNA (cytosine-5)-methyltransferase 1
MWHADAEAGKEEVNELHLFAGAGGGILGGILLGHTTVCAVEIEPYCRKVLLQRQRDGILPRFPIWDDVRTFDGRPWRGLVDVVCGGFPCQDISIAANSAGGGVGITGARSGLWSEMARIICEVQPSIVLVENSPMLTSRGLGVVLGDLARLGYDARWGIFCATDTDLEHQRERIFIHAHHHENSNHRTGQAGNPRKSQGPTKKNRKDWDRSWDELGALGVASRAESYAEGRRIFYGMANGMDRITAIGNGQVPAVVKLAWETLMPPQNSLASRPKQSHDWRAT